jgi:hypothetical protein
MNKSKAGHKNVDKTATKWQTYIAQNIVTFYTNGDQNDPLHLFVMMITSSYSNTGQMIASFQ